MSEVNVENNGGNQTEQHQQMGSSVLENTLEVNNPKITEEEELKGKDDPKKKGCKHRNRCERVKVVDVDICSPRVINIHIVPPENSEGKEDNKKEGGKEDNSSVVYANRPHTHRNRASIRHSNRRPHTMLCMPDHFPAYEPQHHSQNMPAPPPPPPPPPHYEEHHPLGCSLV